MLLGREARDGHCRRHTVCQNLREGSGIFVRKHGGNGPCRSGVLGRKRIATAPTITLIIIFERTLASEGILESRHDRRTIDRCLARKEPRLPLMIVVGKLPEQVKSTAHSGHGTEAKIAEIIAVLY